jgi:hypothetical protein
MNSLKDAFAITKLGEFFSLKYTFAIKPFAQRTPYLFGDKFNRFNETNGPTFKRSFGRLLVWLDMFLVWGS